MEASTRYNLRVVENKAAGGVMLLLTLFVVFILLMMAIGLILKSLPILQENSIVTLLFGSEWKPLQNKFGFLPFIVSTFYVTGVAIIWTVPVSLFTAVFLTEYSRSIVKKIVFPALDILAGIPSVVYGVWGVLVVIPLISNKIAPHFVEFASGYSVLAGGIVLGIMILPLMISLFVELFSVIPQDLRDASLSLGATRWETTVKVLWRRTFPGIIASVTLAISRALGETIAVLMVCGNIVGMPGRLLEGCYPLPALIANNYGEMLSLPMYESALMLAAFILFIFVFLFNIASRLILRRVEKSVA